MERTDDDQHHGHPVSFITFTPEGSRLISADNRPTGSSCAVLCVYKVDTKGRFNVVAPHRRPAAGGITHGVFRTEGMTKKLVTSAFAAAEVPPLYYGGETGAICITDDMGRATDAIPSIGGSITSMNYLAERDLLVVITKSSMLCTFKLTDNKPVQTVKSKLSVGRDGLLDACWCGIGMLACVSGDQVVRVNDLLDDEDNFVLTLADVAGMENRQDKLSSLAYQPSRRLLAAGTRDGHVVVWKNSGAAIKSAPEKAWEALPAVRLDGEPTSLSWNPTNSLLAASAGSSLNLMPETILRRAMRGEWAFLQQGAHEVVIEHVGGARVVLNSKERLKGCDMHGQHVLAWTGKEVFVYKFDDGATSSDRKQSAPVLLASFEHKCLAGAIYGESLFLSAAGRIECTNFSGSIISTLPFADSEGTPIAMHTSGAGKAIFLSAGTDKGFVKSWDVSRKEPRQWTSARKLGDVPNSKVSRIAISSDGSRLAATLEIQIQPTLAAGAKPKAGAPPPPWTPDTRLWLFNNDSDQCVSHDFGATAGRLPTSFYWEASDSKLLGVETRPFAPPPAGAAVPSPLEVTTLFCTPETIKLQNSVAVAEELTALIAVRVPHLVFLSSPATEGPFASDSGDAATAGSNGRMVLPAAVGCQLRQVVMQDFVGMEAADEATRTALVDFSYHLTIGNLDEAHKAVKLVRSCAVWENMARMCVQTKRLDIADVCLGNMGHARGARAVRDICAANTDAEGVLRNHDVCAATVAVQLGMVAEAEQLYLSCGRHDLLNTLYQASGQWDKALKVAQEKDRIHLKATHYVYARQLEASGDTIQATHHFQESDTHRVEVPRMLFDAQQISQLKEFIDRTADKELYKWWAQYAESNARFKEALAYYEKAADHLSIVRVLCFLNKLEKAADFVNQSDDSCAAYHLAKQYEAKSMVKQAIQFFQRSGRFNHAIRLAKAHDLAGELNMMAISAPPRMMVEAAAYFESNGQEDRAVSLYQKGGNVAKAVEICFKSKLFDQLREIAETLPADSDPALIHRCAEFFMDHGQYEKTVRLFAVAGECAKALDMCVLHNINLSEEMAERLCPELGQRGAETEEALNALRLKVAKCAKRQGNYHLACKKYTQAGDKVKAMKCLLKSGDTQKIIYFAGVSRNRDIYILAANYLQNLDWKSDPEIVKSIVQFYSKAKALEMLSAFFDSCAQVEIDDFRDYEKALAALKESHDWMGKARVPGKEEKVRSLATRISHVETFVGARKMVKTDPEATVKVCFELLEQPEVENALRVGDVYALMVEWFHSQGQMDQAYQLIEKMVSRSIVLAPYLDQEMVSAICSSMGMPVPQDPQPAAAPVQMDADEVAEEGIEEDFDD